MTKKVMLLLFVFVMLSTLIIAEAPPSFESQQFYGTVTWKIGDMPKQVTVKTVSKVYTSAIIGPPCVTAPCTGSYGSDKSNIVLVQAGMGEKLQFFVDTIKVGEQVYTSGAVTKADWDLIKLIPVEEKKVEEKLPVKEEPIQNVSMKNVTIPVEEPKPASSSSGSKKSSSVEKNETPVLQSCTKSWTCGVGWGECIAGSQTRKCVDEKGCDKLYAEGKASFVVSGAKPKEVQSCVMPIVDAQVKDDEGGPIVKEKVVAEEELVTPVVQKPKLAKASCSDGLKNQNEEKVDCGGVCKPCEGGLFAGNIMYYILGVVVLIGLGVGAYFFMKSRENAGSGDDSGDDVEMQLTQVYNSGEAKGLSDADITSRLVAKGWDESVIDTFLKGR